MPVKRCLVRTMSDTIETDIHRVHTIANEILPRYHKPKLSFEELRKVADGPFDFFLAPILFEEDYRRDPNIIYNEGVRREIRGHALEIARRHGFDINPPDFIPGVEESLKGARDAGLSNMVLTTSGRRYKHRVMEEHGISEYFEEIIDRDETYFRKEQGIYHLFPEAQQEARSDSPFRNRELPAGGQQPGVRPGGRQRPLGVHRGPGHGTLLQRPGDAGRGQAEIDDPKPWRVDYRSCARPACCRKRPLITPPPRQRRNTPAVRTGRV